MGLNNDIRFYFLNYDFGENLSAVEMASFLRAQVFNMQFNVSPAMLTIKYNPHLSRYRMMLYREGLLHHNSPVINLYEYYQGRSDNLPDIRHRPEEGSDNSIHYQFDEDGLLMSINRYEEKKRVRRDIYDSKGYLGKTQYLDPENGYVRKETYHRLTDLFAFAGIIGFSKVETFCRPSI